MHPFDICAVDLFCFSVLFVVSWGGWIVLSIIQWRHTERVCWQKEFFLMEHKKGNWNEGHSVYYSRKGLVSVTNERERGYRTSSIKNVVCILYIAMGLKTAGVALP